MTKLNTESLPQAVSKLFELNHYKVEGPVHLYGAEFDLVARPISDPFGVPIYIEVTIEYVNNEKYGKDVGKLSIISKQDPSAKKLIISLTGFTPSVIERANASGIETLTYAELFKKFERFEPYISLHLGQTPSGNDLSSLSRIYEEPDFSDAYGEIRATTFLTNWKNSKDDSGQWLVITGEYGTGKTALTKVLLYRWLNEYKNNPEMPLPIRIELRNFVNQFDARGLLHHFLDHNDLSYIPLDYLFSLIRGGRIILILDGYDEMAQYLHARERRACLEALAQLSVDGAKGLLTSRPNYFTETEELQMFELLYKSLDHGKYVLSSQAKSLLQKEKETDQLLAQFIDRYERNLKDLTPKQTETLIRRILSHDKTGQRVVLRLLNRIFRSFENDAEISLSGKPVIVSYLLDVVEGLKEQTDDANDDAVTEWQIYKLIVDQLMLRDFSRSPDILPRRRRDFLRKIAIFLSQRTHPIIPEEDFRDFVSREFVREIERYTGIVRTNYLDKLFTDLRTSATLTRGGSGLRHGWRFSHNSLREYLVAESLIVGLEEGHLISEDVVISDAMRVFARSVETERLRYLAQLLTRVWADTTERGRGQLLVLLWDGLLKLYPESSNRQESCLKAVTGEPPQVGGITLKHVQISTERLSTSLENSDFSDSYLSDIDFQGAALNHARFNGAILEDVNFENSDLRFSDFRRSFLFNCNFHDSILKDANFSQINPDDISIISDKRIIEGLDAIGFLSFMGAKTNDLKPIYVMKHHPKFNIVDKILSKLSMQTTRQRRGLEQRGAAHQDISLAKAFITHLENARIIKANRKDLVDVTEHGRKVISSYMNEKHLSDEIISFLK